MIANAKLHTPGGANVSVEALDPENRFGLAGRFGLHCHGCGWRSSSFARREDAERAVRESYHAHD